MKYLLPILFATMAFGQDIDLTGYTLTFEDNFDVISVSNNGEPNKGSSKWYGWPPYGPSGAYSLSAWTKDALTASGGILNIRAAYFAPYNKWYSGQIASMDPIKQGFAQGYGYFACRMKMPQAGQGAWPSFWLFSQSSIPDNGNRKKLEIDVVEWYGNNPTQAAQTVHYWTGGGGEGPLSGGSFVPIPGGNPHDWHIYGVKVETTGITFYIDGQQTKQIATDNSYLENNPLYVMVAYALGGGWELTGEPFPSKGTSSIDVDWVRVYSLPPVAPTPAPGILKGYFEGYIDGIFVPTP